MLVELSDSYVQTSKSRFATSRAVRVIAIASGQSFSLR